MQAAQHSQSRIASLTKCRSILERPRTLRSRRNLHTGGLRAQDGNGITVEHFRKVAFDVERPLLISQGYSNLPAIDKWFKRKASPSDLSKPISLLNHEYLTPHGSAIVPLELTSLDSETGEDTFSRLDRPLSDFLTYVALREQALEADGEAQSDTSVYLAQHPLPSLPQALQQDLPTPDLVTLAGSGDIYASSVWLGWAPTATPLHRDPNPNLLVQLAGRKRVRLVAPSLGQGVLREARRVAGLTNVNTTVRGEEMMVGAERKALDTWLWQPGGPFDQARSTLADDLWEAEFGPGGAVYIPKGWWHGVRGQGVGVNGSVNWWFR